MIAFPGEKRNAKMMKQLLSNAGLIWLFESEKDVFDVPKLGVRMVSTRGSDAVRMILARQFPALINGLDIVTENLLASRMKVRKDGLSWSMEEWIIGFDRILASWGIGTFLSDDSESDTTPDKSSLTVSWVFDALDPVRLKLLVRSGSANKLDNLSILCRRWDILTSYPYLVRMLLSRKFWGGNVGTIKLVEGKVESLLATGFWQSAVDIVDTGETARRNGLVIWSELFESYPTCIVRDDAMATSRRVRDFAWAMIELSNSRYYDSLRYRERFPRG